MTRRTQLRRCKGWRAHIIVRVLAGQRYGQLTVINPHHGKEKRGYSTCLCRCDCGNEVVIPTARVRYTKSCGCLNHSRNGHSCTPGYATWITMHARCYNPNHAAFKNYGGRGIQVCYRWHRTNPDGLSNFLADMGERPAGLTLGRINNDWSYTPENCRWMTWQEQASNRRPRPVGASGFRRVYRHNGKYAASISLCGRNVQIGTFATAVQASKVYEKVKAIAVIARTG